MTIDRLTCRLVLDDNHDAIELGQAATALEQSVKCVACCHEDSVLRRVNEAGHIKNYAKHKVATNWGNLNVTRERICRYNT